LRNFVANIDQILGTRCKLIFGILKAADLVVILVVVGILANYARSRGFDSRTVQTFVCMNMSVCIGSGCFYV
jgi:hypothetical protein